MSCCASALLKRWPLPHFPFKRRSLNKMNFLVRDLRHPGLHAKKYDESERKWQGRITDDSALLFQD
jgi:hypothetical protein